MDTVEAVVSVVVLCVVVVSIACAAYYENEQEKAHERMLNELYRIEAFKKDSHYGFKKDSHYGK